MALSGERSSSLSSMKFPACLSSLALGIRLCHAHMPLSRHPTANTEMLTLQILFLSYAHTEVTQTIWLSLQAEAVYQAETLSHQA